MANDLKNNIGIVHLLDPADLAYTDTKSKLLDLKGFGGAVIGVQMGAFTGVDGSNTMLPKLQESDSTADTSFTLVDSADMIGEFTLVNSSSLDQTVQYVGYKGTKRYIRVLLDYTGTGITASLVGVFGIVGVPGVSPVTAPAAVTAT